MTYKTIFTALSSFETNKATLEQAVRLAEIHDAHLEIMSLGVDRSHNNYYEVGANTVILQAAIQQAQDQARNIQAEITDWLQTTNLRWNVTTAATPLADAARPVSRAARFADLCVVPLPYRESSIPEESLILETAMLDAGCPIIATPDRDPVGHPERIVIAWNESAEALRTVRAAVPIMKAAKEVHIAIIDPPEHAADRSDPGGALAVMLSRHGINCDIQVMPSGAAKVSERLQRHVTETDAQLVIMGGYGHSRFREAVLGGATRDMLEHAIVPVFMAH